MAGHNNSLHQDPALVRYANMYVHRHQYFRWTPRTSGITLVYAVLIPFCFGYVGYKYDGKFDLRGKRRGDVMSEF